MKSSMNTVESMRKPFINIKNPYLPINKIFRSKIKQKKSHNNSISASSTHNYIKKKMHTSLNSPTKSNELITKLTTEVNQLKAQITQQDDYVRSLEKEIVELKMNKNENNEYEEYTKKQMLRSVKILEVENKQLREEIENYKAKEIKMMKMLYNMSKKGIPIEEMINCAEEDVQESKLDTDKTNLSSTTFTPIILQEQIKQASLASSLDHKPDVVPKLNLDTLNNKYNENYFNVPAYKVSQGNSGNVSITTTTGYSNNITGGVNACSHELLPGSTSYKDKKVIIQNSESNKVHKHLVKSNNISTINNSINKSINGLSSLSTKLKMNKINSAKKHHNTSYNKI